MSDRLGQEGFPQRAQTERGARVGRGYTRRGVTENQRKTDRDWVPAAHGDQTGALQQRVARGLTWTFVDNWGSQFVGFFIFAVLAHLLTKVDFGLVALAMVFVQFAQIFVDQGLGDALIQRKELTRRAIDTAFWVAVVTGLALLGLGLLLAGPISLLEGDPDLAPILAVLSLSFLITSFSSVQLALLRRELAFRSLALRRLAASLGSGLIGIAFAYLGYGAWALVAQQLSWGAISIALLWTASPWRPGLSVSFDDFRSLFRFGINVVGSDVMSFLSRNSDNLMVGTFLGLGPLGLYGVGYRMLDTTETLLVNTSRKLVFPTLSRLQANQERLRRAYSRINRALSVIILPGYIGMALVAHEAVGVFFGHEWVVVGPGQPYSAADVATTLFLIGPSLTIQAVTGSLLYSAGRPDITLRFRLVTTIVHVTGFLVAAIVFQTIVAVAAAFVIGSYLLLPLNLYLQRRYAGISIVSHLLDMRSASIATAVMAAAVLAVRSVLLGHVHVVALLVAEVAVGFLVFEAMLFAIDRQLFMEVLTIGLQALPGGMRVAKFLHIPVTERPIGQRLGRRNRRAAAANRARAALEGRGAEELDRELGSSGGAALLDPSLSEDGDV